MKRDELHSIKRQANLVRDIKKLLEGKSLNRVSEKPKEVEQDIQVPKEGESICDICQIDYRSTSKLVKHIERAHRNVKDFVCTIDNCRKAFTTKKGLNAHKLTHSERNEGKVKCKVEGNDRKKYGNACDKYFTTVRAMKRHLVNKHLPDEQLPCPHNGCNKKFAKKQYRDAHAMTCKKNPDPKLIQCKLCAAEPFKTVSLYLAHMRQVHKHV